MHVSLLSLSLLVLMLMLLSAVCDQVRTKMLDAGRSVSWRAGARRRPDAGRRNKKQHLQIRDKLVL